MTLLFQLNDQAEGQGSNSRSRGRSASHKKKRGRFMAEAFTKELMYTGRIPYRKQGDRIAKYGNGFSNLLTIAGAADEVPAPKMTSGDLISTQRSTIPLAQQLKSANSHA